MSLSYAENSYLNRSTSWIALVGAIGMLVMAIAIMIDVLLRWLFSAPLHGLEDISSLTFAVVIATSFPAGLVQRRNVSVRLISQALPRFSEWLELLGALALLAFFTIMGWQFFVFTLDLTINWHRTLTIELPQAPWWWVTTTIILSCIPIQAVVTGSTLWHLVRSLRA
jgi:TRAP-type transport system small permease protein